MEYIKGKENKIPDSLSRLARGGDYKIKDGIIEELRKKWKFTITMDAFANRKNKKTKLFWTVSNDKTSSGRDALK